METSSDLQAVSPKERIKLILKFLLVGVVFWFLFKKGLVTAESFHLLLASPLTIVTMVVLMILNTFFGAARWQELLKSRDAVLPFSKVLRFNLIGAFFNIALPGAVSGDFVKAVYVAQQFPQKRASAFGSMFLDRVLGLSSMVFVAAFSSLLSLFIPWGGSLPSSLLISIGVLGLFIVLFFVYMFTSHKNDPLFQLIQFFTKRHPKLVIIDKLYLSVMEYRTQPRSVFKAIALSVLIHTFIVVMAFAISETVSAASIPLVALAVIVPIGMLATAIPVLPAGVGTGHAAFFALFKLVGSDQGADVFSLIVFSQIVVGLIGGVIYLRTSHSSRGIGPATSRE